MSRKKLLSVIYVLCVIVVQIYNNTRTHPFLSKKSLSGFVTTSISGLSLIESCEEDTLLCCKEDTLLCSRSDVFAIENDAGVLMTLTNACVEITNIAISSKGIDLDAAISNTRYDVIEGNREKILSFLLS